MVEAGLGHLPFTERTVVTPTGEPYVGVDFAKRLCGVSVIRSGESMENALRACCKGIKIGKILVHRYAHAFVTGLHLAAVANVCKVGCPCSGPVPWRGCVASGALFNTAQCTGTKL